MNSSKEEVYVDVTFHKRQARALLKDKSQYDRYICELDEMIAEKQRENDAIATKLDLIKKQYK